MKCYCSKDTMLLEEKILYISRCEFSYFLRKCNVVAVGLGYKIKNGFNTYKKCIKVFVTHKLFKNRLSRKDLIPKYYKGIETDVVESGTFLMASLRNKIRPVTGGYDVGPISTDDSGSLGCVVTDGHDYYILGNNHILASENRVPIGTQIVQPSTLYGSKDPSNSIATLSKFIELKPVTATSRPINYVDCAIAKIIDMSLVSNKITFIGNIKNTIPPQLGKKVQKVGAATELTHGNIVAIGVTMDIPGEVGNMVFSNQIVTSFMGENGDSGGILLDNSRDAIGMLMGVTTSFSSYNPITKILNDLNVNIVK